MNENGAGLRRIVGSEIHPLPIDDLWVTPALPRADIALYCPTLPKMFVSDFFCAQDPEHQCRGSTLVAVQKFPAFDAPPRSNPPKPVSTHLIFLCVRSH